MRELFVEIGLAEIVQEPTITYCDNTAAIMLAEEDCVTSGNQYVLTPYHYVKECEEAGMVRTIYIRTADNIADLLTKAVTRPVMEALLPKLLGYADQAWIAELDKSGIKTHKQKHWPETNPE